MTSTTKIKASPSQDLLTRLQRLYSKRRVQYDHFGRRTALPSEVARVLAQNAHLRQRPVEAPAED